jgi:peptide chain release factor 3
VRNRDPGRSKQFRTGIAQLDEEGVVQVLRRPDYGDQEPLFGAVGPLQFEVAQHRMANEFGCEISLSPVGFSLARQVDRVHADKLRGQRGTVVTFDRLERCVVLFSSEHALQWARQDLPDAEFTELGMGTAGSGR